MTYSGASGMAPAGMVATGALGDPTAPIAPLQVGGRTGKLRYKVLDPVTGAVLIDDLPHLHQSKWDVVGFQPGAVGRSGIGTWEIKLFPPGSDGYKNAKQAYDLLAKGQRVEPYRADIIAGDPWPQTGFIKTWAKSYDAFTIAGDVSLGLLQAEKTGRSDVFSGRTDQLASYALKAYDLTFGDDFSLGLGNFTNDGGWATTTDPLTGKGAIIPGTTGDGLLYTTASYANAIYADISIEAPFRLTCDATPGAAAEFSLIAALSDTSNFVIGQMLLRYVTNVKYELDFSIQEKIAGSWNLRKKVSPAFILPDNNLPGKLELKGYQASANSYLWRLTINGEDVGCFWAPTVNNGVPSGKIGLRSAKTGVAANETLYAAGMPDGLTIWSKINWFQPGRISLGTQSVNQAIPDTPLIDLLQLAATTENGEYRATPKAGLNQDTLDFGLTVGNDNSASIRFDDTNVLKASIEPDAEPFGSGVQSAASPSLRGAGYTRWYDIANIKRIGRRMISNPASRISDVLAHRYFAARIANLAGNTNSAWRITVKRDEFADRIRELDWVTIHLPAMGIIQTRAKCVGYLFQEGSGEIEYLFNQYPRRLDRLPAMDRLQASVDYLMTKADTATDPANPYAVVRQNSTTLAVLPWKMRAYVTAAQSIPDNAITVVNFDTVDFDNTNSFSISAHTFTVPLAGYYVVSACAAFALAAIFSQLQYWYALIYKNGVENELGQFGFYQQLAGVASSRIVQATVTDTMYLNAGDVLDIRLLANMGAAVPLQAGTSKSYWSVHLISG